MSSNSVTVRRAARDAPLLVLGYGLLRLVDGLDGDRGPGLAWNLGHLAFFGAMLLFGVLAFGLIRYTPAGARRIASIAASTTVLGVVCFLWVITGDLAPGFRDAKPLPEPLEVAGPLAFTLGMLALLGLLVAARRMPFWSPLLFGAGIVAITIELDLLPLAALLLIAAFAPLAASAPADSTQAGHAAGARRVPARNAPGRALH